MPMEFVTDATGITDYIDQVKEKFYNTFQGEITGYEFSDLEFKLSIFLQEVMGNVFEHAYGEKKCAGCAVLIRYIKKPSQQAQNRQRNYFKSADKNISPPFSKYIFTYTSILNLAKNHNPYRNRDGIMVLENYVQIFVVDGGKGILSSVGNAEIKEERELINEIFEKGRRSRARETAVGGLRMLYKLMVENGNYISVKGEYNWASIFCGKSTKKNDALPSVYRTEIEEPLKGLAVVGYIDLNSKRIDCKHFVSAPPQLLCLLYEKNYSLKDIKQVDYFDVIDLRFEDIYLADIKITKKFVLCYVGKNLEKGELVKRLAQNLEKIDGDKKTLIVVDIPQRELLKYDLVFQEIKLHIDKVILLSECFNVAVYTKSEVGKVVFSEFQTNKFINEVASRDISLSLFYLMRMIKYYDSCLFWKIVAEEQKKNRKNLFINSNVGWNYEEGKEMDGYLDFSQICFQRKLKKVLVYQIQRVSDTANRDTYFQSVDRFTEELCEIINGKLTSSHNVFPSVDIKIGSVFVTGTSSKKTWLAQGETEEQCQEYYFFVREGEDKKALLLWPTQKVRTELFGEIQKESLLSRLGKTPFLANGGNAYFMKKHYKKGDDSIYLKPPETYSFLQNDKIWVNRLVKVAHFDMISHHDMIHLNALTAFRKNKMESERVPTYVNDNCFDYMLKSVYHCLGRSVSCNLHKSIQQDINEKYREIVEEKLKKENISNIPGVFVYLSDYTTVEIISDLKKIFSDNVNQRIIPIAPVNRRNRRAALLMSPLLMDEIKDKLRTIKKQCPDKESRVTMFSATVTSAKLEKELKHILFRLGATEVKSLSIVDRQRFPLGSRDKESYASFSKWDLPELGIENNCKICLGVEQMCELEKILLTRDLRKRCDDIRGIWRKTNVSEGGYGIGIDVQCLVLTREIEAQIEEICEKYGFATPVISTDIGLVLFVIENTAITMSTDFLEKCLLEESLDQKVKILLIATHLSLFGEGEIVETLQLELAKQMYIILQRQKKENEYTALACIVLMAQSARIKSALHKLYNDKWTHMYFNNIDFIIVSIGLMFGAKKNMRNEELSYWIQKDNEECLDYLYGVFNYTDGTCATRHGTILLKMINSYEEFSSLEYLSAYNDTQFLDRAYRQMPHSYFASPKEYAKKREGVCSELSEISRILQTGINGELALKNKVGLSVKIKSFMKSASQFNEELFMNTRDSKLKLRGELNNIIKSRESDCYVKQIIYNNEHGDKHFCFIEDLRREISFLVSDFRYADPLNKMDADDGNKYSGIIEVIFEDEYMKYRFTNHVADGFNLEYVTRRKRIKFNRPSILSLRMMLLNQDKDKLFDFSYNQCKKIFTAEIRLPYLNTHKKEEKINV